jgi:hypothetical protein
LTDCIANDRLRQECLRLGFPTLVSILDGEISPRSFDKTIAVVQDGLKPTARSAVGSRATAGGLRVQNYRIAEGQPSPRNHIVSNNDPEQRGASSIPLSLA